MLVLKIALRNIMLQKLKTLVVGAILLFGSVIAIVGNSLVDSIADGLKRSITGSVTGDIQIYSKDAKEKLSVFGSIDMTLPDIGHLNDFGRIRDTLGAQVPNIAHIVPMGTNFAFLNPGNILDVKVEELRQLYKSKRPEKRRIAELKEHVRAITEDVVAGFKNNPENMTMLRGNKDFADAPKNMEIVSKESFWSGFETDRDGKIEFLANKMASLIFDDNVVMFPYVGTVPEKFAGAFPLFEIVKGEQIPPGKRGFLFNDLVYETMVKNRVARRLDYIKKKMTKDGFTIAGSKDLRDKVTANMSQSAEIYSQLSPAKKRELKPKLQKLLGKDEGDIRRLVDAFLDMNDSNFVSRFKFFYDEIAPNIMLYKIKVGDVFPINAMTRSGYSSSVNMKVYGTFRFKSLEDSPVAENFCIIDLISFRDLYGFVTAARRTENNELEREMGLKDAGRDDMESLFSKPDKEQVKVVTEPSKDLAAGLQLKGADYEHRRRVFDEMYSSKDMEDGVFINAAVVLKDPSKAGQTMARIKEVSDKENLGIQALEWREATGMAGQMIFVIRVLLYMFVAVIFVVAAFIIMNSLMMATMERSREIGTMRAIGAQRKFIFRLFLNETFVLSFVFGAIGTGIGVCIVTILGRVGIPATSEVAAHFFSGDRLYPYINPIHILFIFICMTLVAVLSTQIPAWRAMRISPLEAMQRNE